MTTRGRRVALVHHWLVRRRGGERCLDALARLLPGADLFTLVHDPVRCPAPPGVGRVVTSRLQRLPGGRRHFRALLPLLPSLYGSLDLSGYDLVVTSDASVAKTVRPPSGTPHLCYCYSPVRYAWDLREVYLEQSVPAPLRPLARAVLDRVARADRDGARRVDRFVAISRHVAERIARCYGRGSGVVPPPVDTAFFRPAEAADRGAGRGGLADPRDPGAPFPSPGGPDTSMRVDVSEAYLLLGEAVAYKRFDVAVDACRELDRPLVVAGGGPRFAACQRRAGPRTRFVHDPSDDQVRALYRSCRALLFPGEEDFGLVPVEAMACGRPVIAHGRGGAAETVVDGETGVLYPGTEVSDLVAAIRRFEGEEAAFEPSQAVARAGMFGSGAFEQAMRRELEAI